MWWWILAIAFLVLWSLGAITAYTFGGFINILLMVVAIITSAKVLHG